MPMKWMIIMVAVAEDGSYYTWPVEYLLDSEAEATETAKELANSDGDARHFLIAEVAPDALPRVI
jgi:hypothetical protein